MLGEDVEDQGGAVDDLDLDDVLELTELSRESTHHHKSLCRRRSTPRCLMQLTGLAGAVYVAGSDGEPLDRALST